MVEKLPENINHNSIQLEASWLAELGGEFDQDYMQKLKTFLQQEKVTHKQIYPPGNLIFNAFNTTPLDQVKLVILGQDPYHGTGQAHGLCFSVLRDVAIPPSLINIYKELESDLAIKPANHGCLTYWAEQGVLLLNSVLTVEKARAASHQGKGWELFTDKVISVLNEKLSGLVFLLWGSYAQKKGQFIDRKNIWFFNPPIHHQCQHIKGFWGINISLNRIHTWKNLVKN
ncbi:MAG: uracil-DNA glycosylase [Pseudohongiellaceae bacterium]